MLKGFRCGLPIMLGYAPVSFAFAVTAVASGLPWPAALLISLTNFTSAGQVAGANLLAVGAALPEIGVTVFVINIRYMLMSLSLSQKLGNLSLGKRLLLANGVTDEIFFSGDATGRHPVWMVFRRIGGGAISGMGPGDLSRGLGGALLPDGAGLCSGIALYAMFVAIVVPQPRNPAPSAWRRCWRWRWHAFSVPPWTEPYSFRLGMLIFSAVGASAFCAWRFPLGREEERGEGAV